MHWRQQKIRVQYNTVFVFYLIVILICVLYVYIYLVSVLLIAADLKSCARLKRKRNHRLSASNKEYNKPDLPLSILEEELHDLRQRVKRRVAPLCHRKQTPVFSNEQSAKCVCLVYFECLFRRSNNSHSLSLQPVVDVCRIGRDVRGARADGRSAERVTRDACREHRVHCGPRELHERSMAFSISWHAAHPLARDASGRQYAGGRAESDILQRGESAWWHRIIVRHKEVHVLIAAVSFRTRNSAPGAHQFFHCTSSIGSSVAVYVKTTWSWVRLEERPEWLQRLASAEQKPMRFECELFVFVVWVQCH